MRTDAVAAVSVTPAARPASPAADDKPLRDLIHSSGLDDAFQSLILVSGGPSNGRCLLYVAPALGNAFAGRPEWRTTPPFENWDRLAELIRQHGSALKRALPHVEPEQLSIKNRDGLQNPMYGYIAEHPLYAMLCATHQPNLYLTAQKNEDLRHQFGSLQLQVLYARWREASKRAQIKGLTVEAVLRAPRPQRLMRDAESLGRAVRDLSLGFEGLLENLEPLRSPEGFLKRLKAWTPEDSREREIFDVIFNHVARSHDPRFGGRRQSWPRKSPRAAYPEYVEYGSWRIGIQLEHEEEEGFASQSIFDIALPPDGTDQTADTDEEITDKEQDQYDSALDAARKLGIHPAELGRSPGNRSVVEGARSRVQATEVARAKGRSLEIDRRLMPWSSDQLSLSDVQRTIIPTLLEASADPGLSAEDLAAATLVAISLDSARQLRDAVDVTVGRKQRSAFNFEPPRKSAQQVGVWAWDPVGPDYRSKFEAPEDKQMKRAEKLRYTTSSLVTALVGRYRENRNIKSGKLFRPGRRESGEDETDFVALAVAWMKRQSGWENVTPARIARVRWQILHQLTGGELASACLTLGIRAHQASVELHYAVLELTEARDLFAASSQILWGSTPASPPGSAVKQSLDQPEIVGVRACPRLPVIQGVVRDLLKASQAFFGIKPREFDPQIHRELLNKAVLYVVWHQFFCFATRAIRDAYQESSKFSPSNGVAILGDKDFADHHKTRLIWADNRLLEHMQAIEERLEGIRKHLKDHRFPKDSVLFFLDDGKTALHITPKTVAVLLGAEFPFEVNAPRKVMRFLLRKAGLSHEDAEVFMGHWWDAREPWSPFSSFDWQGYLSRLGEIVPGILRNLGFTWIPGEAIR